jgi:hypothetical protein
MFLMIRLLSMIEALGPISYYENKDMTQSNIATYS